MNLSSDSVLCNPLNSSLPFDSYSEVQKEIWDEQDVNFFVDVIYLKLLIGKKPLKRETTKKTAVGRQKHIEYPNACEIQRFKNVLMIFLNVFECAQAAATKWKHRTSVKCPSTILEEPQHGCWTLISHEASTSHTRHEK